ncbi:uncharacterized protein [Antedon mediterranea]|uniref:uncharacterized protein n=1 Tax=Antedon mediterranea TaxID=105859 RepID=UPI003AF99C58
MERLWISTGSIFFVFLVINSVSAFILPRSNKFRCSLCEEKDMLRCVDLKCPPGSTPVLDTCGRCKICGKTENEECGGVCGMFGFCSDGLECYTGPVKNQKKKFDVRIVAEHFSNAGRCMKPSDIPQTQPKKSKSTKPDIVYFSSNNDGGEDKLISEWISSDGTEMSSSSTVSDKEYISVSGNDDSFMNEDTGSGSLQPSDGSSSSDRVLWSEGGTIDVLSSDDSLWSDGSSYTSKFSSSTGELVDASGDSSDSSANEESWYMGTVVVKK